MCCWLPSVTAASIILPRIKSYCTTDAGDQIHCNYSHENNSLLPYCTLYKDHSFQLQPQEQCITWNRGVSSALTFFAASPVLRQAFGTRLCVYVDLGITPPTHPILTTWKINYKHKMALVFHKRLKASRSVLSSPSLVRQLAIGEMIRKGEVEWFLIFSGSNSNRDYDMIVIGGGSGGLACSKEGIYTIGVIFVWYLCLYQIKLCQAYVFL